MLVCVDYKYGIQTDALWKKTNIPPHILKYPCVHIYKNPNRDE